MEQNIDELVSQLKAICERNDFVLLGIEKKPDGKFFCDIEYNIHEYNDYPFSFDFDGTMEGFGKAIESVIDNHKDAIDCETEEIERENMEMALDGLVGLLQDIGEDSPGPCV